MFLHFRRACFTREIVLYFRVTLRNWMCWTLGDLWVQYPLDPWDDCIFTYMHGWVDLYVLNVGKYTSPIDPMGTYYIWSVITCCFQPSTLRCTAKYQRINLHVSSLMISNPKKSCTYLPQKQGFHSNGVHKPCNWGQDSRYVIFPPRKKKKRGVSPRHGKNHHIMHSCESSKVPFQGRGHPPTTQ